MKAVTVENVSYSYASQPDALSNVSLSFEYGSFNVIIGSNGSGKSTFAKILASLLRPAAGTVTVSGRVGIVFQNPDNQIVGDTVEDDVAFAPENMGLPPAEIEKRVGAALGFVKLTDRRYSSVSSLSGGGKVLLSVAGVLAMEPDCIVLDEPTAMLDRETAESVISHLKTINREQHKTIILITQNSQECVGADNVVVFDGGRVKTQGTPEAVFSDAAAVASLGLELPPVLQLSENLKRKGILKTGRTILTAEELAKELKKLC